MKFGFITTEGGTYFKEALEEAVYGEELGFDSVWLEEHHSIRNHYWPSPLMALAGIATSISKLGYDLRLLHHLPEVEEPFEVEQIGSLQSAAAREVFKHLERATDAFEDVANHIDGIVVDHA